MNSWKYIYTFLLLVLLAIVIALFRVSDPNLHIIACDVGQGDAILVVYGNVQILTDGGPSNRVMECLGRYLPFTDRTIELVILTHPQSDHYFGLIEVFKRYKVDNFLYNDLPSSSQSYQLLINEVGSSGARLLIPDTGMVIRLGLISLDIVSPPEGFQSKELNDYSITDVLTYGGFKAILTGDLSPEISDELAKKWEKGTVDYIKIPHHGSKNGITQSLLEKLISGSLPRHTVGVTSVGKNSYGHPSPEILEMLKRFNIPHYRTDEMGDVVVETDGKSFWLKK